VDFSDHYLEVPFDLSQVLFIATANLMDPIPAPLRDRMEVIELPGYTLEEKVEIARQFLLPRQVEQNGIAGIGLEVSDAGLRALCERYTREAGVRNLEREIGSVCRKIALRVAEEGLEGPVRIGPDDLEDLLGAVKYEPELAEESGQPGVAVGLAWTPAGGDILFIESSQMPGQGELKLTGSIGAVDRPQALRGDRRARARSLRCGAEGRTVRRRRHGDLARVPVQRPAGSLGHRHDGRDHLARQGLARGRDQGEAVGREAGGNSRGGPAGAQPQGRR
jgi:ATP-dependent Lon protease